MTRKEYNVVSLFSGGMGLDIGLEQTGRFKVLACVEKAPAFRETIRVNRPRGTSFSPRRSSRWNRRRLWTGSA